MMGIKVGKVKTPPAAIDKTANITTSLALKPKVRAEANIGN
jgi:hypothetical protein